MEGRRKEVLLLVLALLALGVALYTFRGKSAAPAAGGPVAAKPEAAAAQEKPEKPSETAEKPGAEGTAGAGETAEGTASGQQRNPFSAPGGAASASAQPAPAAGGTEPGPEPAAAGPEQGQPEVPGLTLTGIIDGKQTLAILRQDDRRFYVKVGDLVGDGYRVQSIGNQQVVLAGQQGKVILRMGGRQ